MMRRQEEEEERRNSISILAAYSTSSSFLLPLFAYLPHSPSSFHPTKGTSSFLSLLRSPPSTRRGPVRTRVA